MSLNNRAKLEQGRAAYAYKCAQRGKELDKSSEYKAYAKKIPMYIKVNGLGATMAFIWSKGVKDGTPDLANAYGLLYNQIEKWLTTEDEKQLLTLEGETIAEKISNIDSSLYRAVTIEVLALLNWIKRFADGLIANK